MSDVKPKDYDNMPKFTRGAAGGKQRFLPTEKPKNTKGTLIRLLSIFALQKRVLVFTTILTLFSSFVSLSVPYLIGRAINTFDSRLHKVDTSVLYLILGALLAAYLINYLIDTLNGVIMATISQKLIQYMRTEFFSKLQRLPLLFYDTTPHGDTMSRLTNDIDNISGTIAQTTTQLVFSVISILGAFVMMLILSPILTLVAFITIPLVFLLTKSISKKSRLYFGGQQKTLGILNGIIEESVVGLKMVKAFNQQDHILKEFEKTNDELKDYATKANTWSGYLMPFMNVINNLSFTFVATAGGFLTVSGGISVGVVVSFLSYSRQFGQPLNNIAGMFNTIQSALAGAERVFEILDLTEETKDCPELLEFSHPKGSVTFKHVSFSYHSEKKVLDNISFHVNAGDTVALVGETGAGKTTIVNLLTRFYEINEGEILIDGVNISDISRKNLRECFSIVLQDTCLFTGTIADNIKYSNQNATDDKLIAAAKLANADDFITKLPAGYQTTVTGSTDNLSQGQRQLLAIARAILCDAPILILDEATSSVDTRTEKNIQQAMRKLMQGRTSFIIAHRLSTIKDADTIMVINNGRISEYGTHEELMVQKGDYYQMVCSQMGVHL